MEGSKHCLVDRWGDFLDQAPNFTPLKKWIVYNWNLKGKFHLALLRGSPIFSSLRPVPMQRRLFKRF